MSDKPKTVAEEALGELLIMPLPMRMTTTEFRLRQFLASLSPTRRVAVANRPRFHTMPWLRRTDEPTDDFLP